MTADGVANQNQRERERREKQKGKASQCTCINVGKATLCKLGKLLKRY